MKEVTFEEFQNSKTISIHDFDDYKDHAVALKNNKMFLIINNIDEKTGIFYGSKILNLRTLKFEKEIEKQTKVPENYRTGEILEIFNSFGYKIYTARNTMVLFQKMLDHWMEVSEIL